VEGAEGASGVSSITLRRMFTSRKRIAKPGSPDRGAWPWRPRPTSLPLPTGLE
jgi:hypothetical protein